MTKSIGQSRLLQEMKSMVKDKAANLFSQPLENDLFIWHFTILGPQNTDFHQGIYHGQIVLPFEYPFKPPDIYFFTKNGRFEVSTKICLTITQYHPEQWNAGWTIRTMLQAVISLFNEHVPGVGYVESTSQIRKSLAQQSKNYVCEKCGPIAGILTPRKPISSKDLMQINSVPIKTQLPTQVHNYFKLQQKKQSSIKKPSSSNEKGDNKKQKQKMSLGQMIRRNKNILSGVILSSRLQRSDK